MADFNASLSRAAPAPGLDAPLAALWWAAKGNWDEAHKIAQDQETLTQRGSMPICTGSKAIWQRRLLVPPGRQAGCDRFAGNRMGADGFRAAREWKSMTCRQTAKLIKGATGDWEMVIGLEVHAQVTSNSKLFSGASTEFGGEPNTHVSLVDAAMPGMLPVINEECVRQAVRTGLGLNAQINLRSVFDRKNYFYPDSPQGYQISQYKSPIVGEGEVDGRAGQRRDRRRSASSGCIWSRTPASCCTTRTRPCPSSISTAPASR